MNYIERQTRQIKKRGFDGVVCYAHTLQFRAFLELEGIPYVLDFSQCFAACEEQRVWIYDIGIIRGISSKKALAPQRDIAAYMLNWYAIKTRKQMHLHGEICRYAGAFFVAVENLIFGNRTYNGKNTKQYTGSHLAEISSDNRWSSSLYGNWQRYRCNKGIKKVRVWGIGIRI